MTVLEVEMSLENVGKQSSPFKANNDSIVSHIASKVHRFEKVTALDLQELESYAFGSTEKDIPYLTRSMIQTGQATSGRVFQFVGMVQDMLDVEFYVSQPHSQGPFLDYRDDIDTLLQDQHTSQLRFQQRTPLLVVPLPHVSPWWQQALEERFNRTNHSSLRKRALQQQQNRSPAFSSADNQDNSHHWWPPSCQNSHAGDAPVLAKLYYDHTTNKPLALNEMVHMVGIISMHETTQSTLPTPSQMPRLHVLVYRRLPQLEWPHLGLPLPMEARACTIQSLSHALGTTHSLAEALLMAFMSMAERKDDGTPHETPQTTLGCASIHIRLQNATACRNLASHLHRTLTPILPTVVYFDFTSTKYTLPHKQHGRLGPTPWQLPKGATVILDIGDHMESLEQIQTLLKRHVLPYRFEGILYPLEADYRVILLSARRSPCSRNNHASVLDCTWQTTATTTRGKWKHAAHIRHYLQNCRRPHNISLSRPLLERAQHDFVQRRQQGNSGVDENTFHRWLTLARLQARSRLGGESCQNDTSATVQDWERALALDDALQNH